MVGSIWSVSVLHEGLLADWSLANAGTTTAAVVTLGWAGTFPELVSGRDQNARVDEWLHKLVAQLVLLCVLLHHGIS